MKAVTNNMVGLTDNLDKSLAFAGFENEKGTLYFTGKSHYKFYNRVVRETGIGAGDKKDLTLFYLLSSLKNLERLLESFSS